MSIYASLVWAFIILLGTQFDDKNELEKNLKLNEHQKTKRENEHLQSVFLTFIFIFFNALILLLFNEDDKLQKKIDHKGDTGIKTRSKSVYMPLNSSFDKAKKLNELKKMCI